VDPGLEICSSCGASLSLFPPDPLPPAPPPAPRWRRQALSATLVLAVLSLAVSSFITVETRGKLLGLVIVLIAIVLLLAMAWLARWGQKTAEEDGVVVNNVYDGGS
jgi:hypothetical protein